MTIATVPAAAIAGRSYAHDAGRLMLSGIHRSQQITQLVDEAGQHRPGVAGTSSLSRGITPCP